MLFDLQLSKSSYNVPIILQYRQLLCNIWGNKIIWVQDIFGLSNRKNGDLADYGFSWCDRLDQAFGLGYVKAQLPIKHTRDLVLVIECKSCRSQDRWQKIMLLLFICLR